MTVFAPIPLRNSVPPITLELDSQYVWACGYELISHVGSGTYADVWQVRHRETGQKFAWKQLNAKWADDPAARRLLANEAEVGRAVNSRHVVRVVEAQTDRAPRFLLLDWHEGQNLKQRLTAEGRLPAHQALWIARQCAQGLVDLAAAGYTHGDIKPMNILIGERGDVRLIDLAFARPFPARRPACDTETDLLTGTPEYLAPEALAPAAETGTLRDVYSLGSTLYRMLTGRLPFQGETLEEVLRSQREAIPRGIRHYAPEVPREVAEFAESLLAKQPLRRPVGLNTLVDQLVRFELMMLPLATAG